MEMPVNIVPAPFGALVALYVGTHSIEIHDGWDIELDEQEESDELFYMIRPVVAWGFYEHRTLGLTNNPIVADDTGKLVLAGLRDAVDVPDSLVHMRDWYSTNFGFDSVCTPLEAEARISEITKDRPQLKVSRWSCGTFAAQASLDLPADFRPFTP